MTAFLLDVNVLIALLDPSHVHHDTVHVWFSASNSEAWATCPLTENAVTRIVSDPRYPNSPGSPAAVAALLAEFCALPGHLFWADDISVLDARYFDCSRLLSSRQITDTYLIALAKAHSGQLATLDRRIVANAAKAGTQAVHQIL